MTDVGVADHSFIWSALSSWHSWLGFMAPVIRRVTLTTPAGRSLNISASTTVSVAGAGGDQRLLSKVDSTVVNGSVRTTEYDAVTRTQTVTTPAGRRTTTRYDSLGRPVEFHAPGIATIRTTFDTIGRLATTTQFGRTVRYEYGANGLVTRTIDPLGQLRSFERDSAGRVVTLRSSDGRTTRYTYDAVGHRIGVMRPGGQSHGYTYDRAGRLETYTQPAVDGQPAVGRYAYDRDGRRISFTRPDGSEVRFNYDAAGRRSSIVHADGQVTVEYDTRTGMPIRLGAAGEGGVISLAYDGTLVTTSQMSGLVSGVVAFDYDSQLRLSSQTINGQTVALEYDPDGLLRQAGSLQLDRATDSGELLGTRLFAVTTRAGVDSLGVLVADTARIGDTQLFAYQLTRDSLERVTAKREIVDGVEVRYAYAYDAAGRLAEVRRDGNIVASYEYDANGNRTRYVAGGGELTGTYDARDRLVRYGDASYTFNASGQLTARTIGIERTDYHYDALANLLRVVLPDGRRIEYVVDAMSRRVAKKVNGTVVKRFLYGDGPNPMAEVDAQGNVITRYVYGVHTNVPAYMERNGVTYRLLTDHLGSVRLVVDASTGTPAQRLDYDEFGRVVANSNPGFQPFGYAGGLYDEDTRLVRFATRDYDAETGRWTAMDPLHFRVGDESLYAYVSNAPLNAVDPTGLEVNCNYSQWTGELQCVNEDGVTMSAKGYSGSQKREGCNEPSKENIKNTGPIVRGSYKIEDGYYGGKESLMNLKQQPALSLTPDAETAKKITSYGRDGGFVMHDDLYNSGKASLGCIIVPWEIRHWIQANGGGTLTVTVYPDQPVPPTPPTGP